jgi:hypothetical protein
VKCQVAGGLIACHAVLAASACHVLNSAGNVLHKIRTLSDSGLKLTANGYAMTHKLQECMLTRLCPGYPRLCLLLIDSTIAAVQSLTVSHSQRVLHMKKASCMRMHITTGRSIGTPTPLLHYSHTTTVITATNRASQVKPNATSTEACERCNDSNGSVPVQLSQLHCWL